MQGPHQEAQKSSKTGFSDAFTDYRLSVRCDDTLLARLPENKREDLLAVLAEDPRPAYQEDPDRICGFPFAGFEVKFSVLDGELTVTDIIPIK